MIRRSAALRTIAATPLFFCVLIACRLASAYSGISLVQGGTLTLNSAASISLVQGGTLLLNNAASSSLYQLNTNGNFVNALPTAAPPLPQLEYIATDRTGHPVNGIPDTYQPKYNEGYGLGYATGYDSGLITGKQRGTDVGTANGRNDGYNTGFGESYQPAFDLAYNTQLPIGKEAGWNQGNAIGFAEGYDWAPTFFGSTSLSGNLTIGGGNWGSSSGVMMTFGNYGFNSNFRSMSPDEVPAFYYKLGLDDGNTKGASDGSADGYKITYPDAYAARIRLVTRTARLREPCRDPPKVRARAFLLVGTRGMAGFRQRLPGWDSVVFVRSLVIVQRGQPRLGIQRT